MEESLVIDKVSLELLSVINDDEKVIQFINQFKTLVDLIPTVRDRICTILFMSGTQTRNKMNTPSSKVICLPLFLQIFYVSALNRRGTIGGEMF